MTNFKDRLLDENKENLTQYDKLKLKTNFKRFLEISAYDFNKQIIKKNIGNELRTFHILDQSKPLISPSRLSSLFNEHLFWNIPKKTLLIPRLLGQLVHKFLELRLVYNEIIKLNLENLEEYCKGDYLLIKENWSQEKILIFIDEVNEAVDNIYNYLSRKGIKIIAAEKYVCNNNFHGFIDLVGLKTYVNSREKIPMIIDLKITSNDEIINTYYVQLSLYREIYERTANCYILFYNRDRKTPRLEKASWAKLNETYEIIEKLNNLYRD